MLAALHPHARDSRISFEEEPHIYTIDGSSSGYVSVTSLKKRFWTEFDADLVISKMMRSRKWSQSKWHGMSRQEIKDAWDQNRDEAAAAGTAMHLNIEHYLNNQPHESQSKEWQLFCMFKEAHADLLPYRTEMLVFDEDVRVAGSIDLVCRDPTDEQGYLIYDWKRSKCIDTFNTYEKGFDAASDLDNCNFNHYSLQLATYRHILQTKYGMKVNGCFLVVLHPEQSDFILMQTEDMQALVDAAWEQRAQKLQADKENNNNRATSSSPQKKKLKKPLESIEVNA